MTWKIIVVFCFFCVGCVHSCVHLCILWFILALWWMSEWTDGQTDMRRDGRTNKQINKWTNALLLMASANSLNNGITLIIRYYWKKGKKTLLSVCGVRYQYGSMEDFAMEIIVQVSFLSILLSVSWVADNVNDDTQPAVNHDLSSNYWTVLGNRFDWLRRCVYVRVRVCGRS